MFLFLLVALALAQPECPRDLYCSTMTANCQARCGTGQISFISYKPCLVGQPDVPYACVCQMNTLSCFIPVYDTCIDPALDEQQCWTQSRSPTFAAVFDRLSYNNCTVLDCPRLSTNTIGLRVPTPAPPTSKPTYTKYPTTVKPTASSSPTTRTASPTSTPNISVGFGICINYLGLFAIFMCM